MIWSLLLFSFGFGFVCVLSDSIYLNTNWIITNDNKNITLHNQNIPSGIYSALEDSSQIESILFSYNDVNLRWVSKLNWTYTLTFNVPKNIKSHKNVLITFHGIDTLSKIYLNEVLLGTTTNMFIRYTFNIKDVLKFNENILRIELVAPAFGAEFLASKNPLTPPECPPKRYNGECHMNFLRKMQASFSWDWGLAAPSMGIWKSVIIEYYDSAIIRDVTYVLEETENFWNILTTVYLEAGIDSGELEGELSLKFIDTESIPTKTSVKNKTINGEIAIDSLIKVSKSNTELWWPNGFGKQQLYHLRVDWKGITNELRRKRRQFYETQKIIKIGFRTIELIQEPAEMGLSFYFRVNKIPIFMKGSNWIPSNILPEHSVDRKKIKHLLQSAKDSHMNMLRVWGGGIYENDYFYDLADSYGILIWQDMMFACAMYPTFPEFLESVKIEIKQNIRRLQKHPSIAIWAANNENEAALQQNWYGTKSNYDRFANEYRKLYVGLIKPVIESNDKSRTCLTSSPSNGDKGKEDNWISNDPQDYHYGDIHYYNYDLNGWDPNIYPKPRFTSEYGFQSYPSLTAWKSVLGQKDNLTELMDHRQHSPLGNTPIEALISKNLPLPSNGLENYEEALIYMSQISQAMAIKMETEVYRNERGGLMGTMGALYWQLNDVWVAPSWSSIEFDGKFKILQYWAKEFLAPMHVTCHLDKTGKVSVVVIRDTLGNPADFKIVIKVFKWSSFSVVQEEVKYFVMEENSVKLVYSFKLIDYIKNELNPANSFMEISLRNAKNKTLATNYVLPEKIKNCKGIQKSFIQAKISASRCQFSKSIISMDVTSRSHAVFVYLEITNELIKNYKFSKNGFIQTAPIQTVYLEFENLDCKLEVKIEDVKIMDVSQFMGVSPN